LGIGKFLLLELNVPEIKKLNDSNWKDLYERLILRITQTEEYIKKGEWDAALKPIRHFYDNLKFLDSKPNQKQFKGELKELFFIDNHNEESFNAFYSAIENLFDFSSKYNHDDDKNGVLKEKYLIARKEDVYLFYSLAIAILNLISKKLVKKDGNCK